MREDVEFLDEDEEVDVVSHDDGEIYDIMNDCKYGDSKKEESTQEMIDEVISNEKKKGLRVFIFVLIFMCGILGGGLFYYNTISKKPMFVFKNSVNLVYNSFHKGMNFYDGVQKKISLSNKPLNLSGDISLKGDTYRKIEDDKISYELGIDNKNESFELSASLEEHGEGLIDITVWGVDGKAYMKSDTLFDSVFEIGRFDYGKIRKFILDDSSDLSDDDIDYIISEVRYALIKSLDEKDMSVSEEKIKINKKVVKAKKVSYKINEDSLKKIFKTFSKELGENDLLISDLSKLFNESKSNIKKVVKGLADSDFSDIGDGSLNIYLTGILNKPVMIQYLEDDEELSVSFAKDYFYLLLDSDDKVEVESSRKKDKVNLVVREDGENIIKLKTNSDDNEINIDYDINLDDIVADGKIKLTRKINDKKVSGKVDFTCNYDTLEYGFVASYSLENSKKIASYDNSGAILIENVRLDDLSKYENALLRFGRSDFFDVTFGERFLLENYIRFGDYDL